MTNSFLLDANATKLVWGISYLLSYTWSPDSSVLQSDWLYGKKAIRKKTRKLDRVSHLEMSPLQNRLRLEVVASQRYTARRPISHGRRSCLLKSVHQRVGSFDLISESTA